MEKKATAYDWLGVTGAQITETPKRVIAECLRSGPYNGQLRPAISFNPADPESVARARNVAIHQNVPPRVCGEYCPLPCTMRRLEDSDVNYLMSVFGINNTGSDDPENPSTS